MSQDPQKEKSRQIPDSRVKWEILPHKMAMIIIDMEKAFCSIGGAIELPTAREIVPNINRLTECCRKEGIPVIWVRRIHRHDGSDEGVHRIFWPKASQIEMGCLEGTEGTELYEDLKVDESDYFVKKIRYSAFIQGSSDLEPLVRGLNRDMLIVTGVATNVCCGITIANASELGFKVFAVSDGMATFSKEAHESWLDLASMCWAQVISTDELIGELESHKP